MSVKKTALFKLSQFAKRLIATAPVNKRSAQKKIWVDAEANATYSPRKTNTGAVSSGASEL